MTSDKPIVLMALLPDNQRGALLEYWLESVSDWDYPEDRIVLYVNENYSLEDSHEIIAAWTEANRSKYLKVINDHAGTEVPFKARGIPGINTERFSRGMIREASLKAAADNNVDFYISCASNNFLLPFALRKLVEHNLPIVAPFLRYATSEGEESNVPYSNYHHDVDDYGYFRESAAYHWLLNQEIRGLMQCQVVHGTYLIRRDVIPFMKYVEDDPNCGNYEYVTFSNNCRTLRVPQYLDNRLVYGCVTLTENLDAVTQWMQTLSESETTIEPTWR